MLNLKNVNFTGTLTLNGVEITPFNSAADWSSGTHYKRGSVVLRKTGAFVCAADSSFNEDPIETPSTWSLFATYGPVLTITNTDPIGGETEDPEGIDGDSHLNTTSLQLSKRIDGSFSVVANLARSLATVSLWDVSTEYAQGDYVRWRGGCYQALEPSVGDDPEFSPSQWRLYANGVYGASTWQTDRKYYPGAFTILDGKTYICLYENTNLSPDENSASEASDVWQRIPGPGDGTVAWGDVTDKPVLGPWSESGTLTKITPAASASAASASISMDVVAFGIGATISVAGFGGSIQDFEAYDTEAGYSGSLIGIPWTANTTDMASALVSAINSGTATTSVSASYSGPDVLLVNTGGTGTSSTVTVYNNGTVYTSGVGANATAETGTRFFVVKAYEAGKRHHISEVAIQAFSGGDFTTDILVGYWNGSVFSAAARFSAPAFGTFGTFDRTFDDAAMFGNFMDGIDEQDIAIKTDGDSTDGECVVRLHGHTTTI